MKRVSLLLTVALCSSACGDDQASTDNVIVQPQAQLIPASTGETPNGFAVPDSPNQPAATENAGETTAVAPTPATLPGTNAAPMTPSMGTTPAAPSANSQTGNTTGNEMATTSNGSPNPTSTAENGTYTVSVQEAVINRGNRSIEVAAHMPSEDGVYPLLVFAGGFSIGTESYIPFADFMAQWGFVVIRADLEGNFLNVSHTEMSLDLGAVMDWAIGPAPFANKVDNTLIGTVGHSLGGKLATMAAINDDRVGAVLGIDPVDGDPSPLGSDPANRPDLAPGTAAQITVPVGFIGETTNGMGSGFTPACAPLDNNFQNLFDGCSGAPWAAEWNFIGADHMDFVWQCPQGGFVDLCGSCPDGTADPEQVRENTKIIALAFFKRHLLNDAAQDAVLMGDRLPAGIEIRTRGM